MDKAGRHHDDTLRLRCRRRCMARHDKILPGGAGGRNNRADLNIIDGREAGFADLAC